MLGIFGIAFDACKTNMLTRTTQKNFFGLLGLSLLLLTYGHKEHMSNEVKTCDERSSELEQHVASLKNCVEKNISLALQPLDCTMLEKIIECINKYISNVKDCYAKDLQTWNQTTRAVTQAKEYLCKNEASELNDLYRLNGVQCLETSQIQDCGSSLATVILNPKSYHNITKEILMFNDSRCRNYTEVDNCVATKLKKEDSKICNKHTINITENVQSILNKELGCHSKNEGSSDSSTSSTIIWILAIAVTSVVVLTPS